MKNRIISGLLAYIVLICVVSVNVNVTAEDAELQEDIDIIVINEQGNKTVDVDKSDVNENNSNETSDTNIDVTEDNNGYNPVTDNKKDESDTTDVVDTSVAEPSEELISEQEAATATATATDTDTTMLRANLGTNHYASGRSYALRIYNGKVQAIGSNSYGQLGTGDYSATNEFVDVIPTWGDKAIVQVETRGNTSFALTQDGELYAWGDNSRGQFGNGTTNSSNQPVRAAAEMTGISKVSAGLEHTLISAREVLYVFGDNTYGQLCGVSDAEYVTEPIRYTTNLEYFEAGDYQTYYTGTDGEYFGYGKNDKGQLGSETDADGNMLCLRKICAGSDHVAAMGYDDKLYVWGDNNSSQLGIGNDILNVQNPINTGITISNVYAGGYVTVYVSEEKSYITGQDVYGNLMDTSKFNIPEGYSEMSLGEYSFAYYPSGEVWHWGYMINDTHVIEEGTQSPVKIEYPYDIVDIDATRYQVIATDTNGDVVTWGTGYYSDNTDKMDIKYHPSVLNEYYSNYEYNYDRIPNTTSVSRGKNHNLVLDKYGDVWGWGSNSNYPMGDAAYLKVNTATKIPDISDVKAIEGGTEFSLFIKNDGSLWGVGKNDKYQMGYIDETENAESAYNITPIRITERSDFLSVTAGEDFAAAIASDGLYTWGGNQYGQLGNGNNENSVPQKIVVALEENEYFTEVKAGTYHCIALTNKGNVYSWGRNGVGQLGIGNKTNKNVPSKISISDVKYINASENQSYAIKNDGTVWAWGTGGDYRLGINNTGSNQKPVHISSLDGMNVEKVVGGNGFSIVVDKNGSMYSFGSNTNGGLGVYSQYPTLYYSDYSMELRELNRYMKSLPDKIVEDITLPTELTDASILWTSSNEYYISPNGIITRPNKFGSDEKVRLTAEVNYKGKNHDIYYYLIVAKEEGEFDNSGLYKFNVEKGNTYIINIIGKNILGFDNRKCELIYDAGKIEIVDAITQSRTFETGVGEKYGDVTLEDSSIGCLKFSVSKSLPSGMKFSGFINGIVIRAKETCQTTLVASY